MRLAGHDLEVGSTAHRQSRSGDVASCIGGEKDGGIANIFRLAHTAQEDAFGYCLPLLVANDSNHRGFDRSRRDRIYADAEAAHLVGQIARECDDSGLRRGVRNMRDGHVECSDRSDIDDRAALARDHLGQHLATAEKDAFEIDGEHTVPFLFGLFGSVRLLMEDLNRRGIRSKVRVANNDRKSGGNSFFRGALYVLLSNPIYIGEIRHNGVRHPGLHEPILDRELWDSTQLLLRSRAVRRAPSPRKSAASPLTGRLFDESGQSLTPSHAVKGERRYRYYVSRNLVKGTADAVGRGWRLPAPEIERTVAAAACQILSDQAAIAIAAHTKGLAESQLPTIFLAAEAWSKRLQLEVEASVVLTALVDRVDLTDAGIRLSLKLPLPDASRQLANATELILSRVFPLRIRRRGVEMRLVIEGPGAPTPRADRALLKAVARAHQWSDDLVAGRAQSIAEIAQREGVSAPYIRRMVQLAFLAPRITEMITAGSQPPDLTAEALAERIDLPLLWTAQDQAVGIN
jgi:site-specific DNA recombinase